MHVRTLTLAVTTRTAAAAAVTACGKPGEVVSMMYWIKVSWTTYKKQQNIMSNNRMIYEQ